MKDEKAIVRDARLRLRAAGYSDEDLSADGDACGLLDIAVEVAKFVVVRDRQRQGCRRAAKRRKGAKS